MARRGRPNLRAVDAVAAHRRFRELRAEGAGIAEAERTMTAKGDVCESLTSPQGARKRRTMGEAVEPDFAFKEFCVAAIGPLGWFMRRDYFSYKRRL